MSDPEIRAEEPGDEDAIRAVHDRAFGWPVEGALVDALRGTDAWLPHLSLVADVGGVVVGHVLLTRVEVGEPGASLPALALAPMAVLPEWQGQGVGSALGDAALSVAQAAGEHLVLVLGDPAYYARFGFRPAGERGILCPWPEAAHAYGAVALSVAGDEASGPVRYPPPFDAF